MARKGGRYIKEKGKPAKRVEWTRAKGEPAPEPEPAPTTKKAASEKES